MASNPRYAGDCLAPTLWYTLREFDQLTARLAERNAAYSDEEVAADVAAVMREVRAGFSLRDGGAS